MRGRLGLGRDEMDEVLRIVPDEISFAIRPGELCRVTCEYTNIHSAPVTYNVRTTNTDLYCVRLNKDVIQPGETKSVVFIRRAFESVPNDLVCKDRFQVLVLKLDDPELAYSPADEIWKGRKKYDFQRKFPVKLCVDLEPPISLDKFRDSLLLDSSAQNGNAFTLGQLPSAAPELPSMPSALLPSANFVAPEESPPFAPNNEEPPKSSPEDLVPRTATGTVLPFGDSFTAAFSDSPSPELPPQKLPDSSVTRLTSPFIPPPELSVISSTAQPSAPIPPVLPPKPPLEHRQISQDVSSLAPIQLSETANNVPAEVERLTQVEPEFESAAVTAAAAAARIRAEQAELRASLSQKSLSANDTSPTVVRAGAPVANDSEPARTSPTVSTSDTSARVDITAVGSTHPFFGDRVPSPPAPNSQRVASATREAPQESTQPLSNVTEDEDGEGYAQAEAITSYTPTAADEDRKRELDERKRVAAEEEAKRLEEERLRAEAAAKARAEEIARKAREAELERVRTRRQVETARAAPRSQIPVLEGARAQRAAVDRACALYRMVGEREREIARLTRELVEARHKLSNARIGAAPLHDTIYETDPAARITIAQVAIMAALSGALLTLFL